MKKETLLTISVVLLLVLNFGTLAYLFTTQRHHPPFNGHEGRRGNPVDRIIRGTLHFTEEQDMQFERMKHEHHEKIVELDEEYQHVLLRYFDLLKDEAAPALVTDSLEKEMARIQIGKATVTYDHFKELRGICTPEQKTGFDSILPQIMQVISPPRRGGPPPRE